MKKLFFTLSVLGQRSMPLRNIDQANAAPDTTPIPGTIQGPTEVQAHIRTKIFPMLERDAISLTQAQELVSAIDNVSTLKKNEYYKALIYISDMREKIRVKMKGGLPEADLSTTRNIYTLLSEAYYRLLNTGRPQMSHPVFPADIGGILQEASPEMPWEDYYIPYDSLDNTPNGMDALWNIPVSDGEEEGFAKGVNAVCLAFECYVILDPHGGDKLVCGRENGILTKDNVINGTYKTVAFTFTKPTTEGEVGDEGE